MKSCYVIIAILGINIAFAQNDINNTKTEKHIQVKGTKFFLIPPAGFAEANNFQGFHQAESNASVVVMEIAGPFADVVTGLNEQSLKTKGVILKSVQEITVNGNKGSFMATEQTAYGQDFTKYILVFGNDSSTFMVNGMFPKDKTALDNGVVASIRSVIDDQNVSVNPLSGIDFMLNTKGTKLKFAKLMNGMALYTVDGKVPTQSEDKTFFIAGQSVSKTNITDTKLYSINRLKKLPYNDLVIDEGNITSIDIDGIAGYELLANGTPTNGTGPEMIYQAMLFTEQGYYLFAGTAKNDYENNVQLFKNITRSFKRKPK
jgi:hypothetical protein